MPRPLTALIVDDESHVRIYLRMLLQRLGVKTVHEAADGAQALQLYAAHQPEVVLLDVVMPGKTGPSVIKDLQALNPEVPVIVVTSQSSYKTVQEIHDLGAIAYLLKHTPYDQMVKMLGDALDLAGEPASENSSSAGDTAG